MLKLINKLRPETYDKLDSVEYVDRNTIELVFCTELIDDEYTRIRLEYTDTDNYSFKCEHIIGNDHFALIDKKDLNLMLMILEDLAA